MTNKKNILIAGDFSQDTYLKLTQKSFLNLEKVNSSDLSQIDLSQTNGLIVRSQTQVDSSIFSRAKNLQVVITATSGFDQIDLQAAKKWGVTVMHTPEANIESATQLTWSLILACATKLFKANKSLRGGSWRVPNLTGIELSEKTIGIVGLGRIGKRVAEIAEAFNMSIIAYDPYIDGIEFHEVGAERVAFEEILKRADILSFHVPKTSETQHMLNRSHFEYINRGIILINTSRGSILREQDLADAIEAGWIGGAGLDVFENEPLNPGSRLLLFENLVLTPHVGAFTSEAFLRASEAAAQKLIGFFMDGSTMDTLPPKAAWYGAVSPWKTLSKNE